MSLFDDIDGLLPGLLPAAWRGRPFWVINAQHSVGRRIQQVLYPGLDLKTHDDAGPLDGPIRISGLVIGDDYVAQAEALGAAFRQAGPATLIHPWRGPIRCVLFRPAQIEFDVKELRVARIDAEFDPVSTGPALLLGSLTAALSALTGLTSAAIGLAGFVLGASPIATAIRGRAISALGTGLDVATDWSGRASRSAALLPLLVASQRAFVTAAAVPGRAASAAALSAVLPSTFAAMAQVHRPQPASGLGAGDAAAATAVADPRAGASLLIAVVADLGRRLRPGEAGVAGLPILAATDYPTSSAERAALLSAEAAALAEAAGLVLLIPFESRQDAQAYAAAIDARLRACMTSAAGLAQELAAPAAALWRALSEARSRLALDLSEAAGRLPSVRMIEPPARGSALLLAQHLVGDDPSAVIAFARDVVRRNRLRHPAVLGHDPVEVLQ